ncbi:Class II Aldolase and Adducin N-terminal domain protein [Acididesulfobacillus acetoxydans]|uniref:Class II Aldolase and Adducin N-terminal domain protein n=1 Tax=Acididesulfobacillus acetoxydans TaxID=1561005 RepID=A0A8S0W9M7_9FIRM|nr:class II aldolase/adducin family protein [Acididesulfobacillus acetoxydans]CAA7602719.1 Class II Aldolase and Adducin N-terminal domain protein [Acididesulfobacillus acetoxydans]CEJ06424.1 L-fuculose-phosphate aldolase [Acididesulfobacillus acetoxydans]
MNLGQRVLRIGRELVISGAVAGTWGNVSAWDEEKEGFWITPSGMDYLSLQEEDLVLLNIRGEIREGSRRPSSELPLHLEIYRQRPDVKGVIHTHSVHASAHAAVRLAIPPLVEDLAMIVGGEVPVSAYQPPGSRELALAAVKALGSGNAVLLPNHGLVGVGTSPEEAWKVCRVCEKGAQIHVFSRLLGQPVLFSDEEVRRMREAYVGDYGQPT